MFLGKFDGILVNPCLEQSTMAPSLAQVHEEGHKSAEALTDSLTKRAKRSKNLQPMILFMVEVAFFTGSLQGLVSQKAPNSIFSSQSTARSTNSNWASTVVKTTTTSDALLPLHRSTRLILTARGFSLSGHHKTRKQRRLRKPHSFCL